MLPKKTYPSDKINTIIAEIDNLPEINIKILNKIIKQLYDIANCKHVIDDNDYHDDDYDMKFLEKTVETTDFNIEEFKDRIKKRIGDLKKKQESLTEKQSAFDKKAEENYDNFKKPFTKLFGKSKDLSKDLDKLNSFISLSVILLFFR